MPLEQAALPLLLQIALKCRGAAGTHAVRSKKWPASPAAAQAAAAAATLLPAVVMSGSPQQQRGPASAPFVQAEAPSERLIDTLSKLDHSVAAEATAAPPRTVPIADEPEAEPQPHSNVTYIVSRPTGGETAASNVPPLVLTGALGLLISLSLPPFMEAYLDVTTATLRLQTLANSTALHVPTLKDKWRDYEQTEHTLVAWHRSLEETKQTMLESSSLIDIVSDHELQLVQSVLGSPSSPPGESAGLPATQEPYVWLTIALGAVLCTATSLRLLGDATESGGTESADVNVSRGGASVLRLLAALLALVINLALLALVAKVIVLNDVLTTVISPLRGTQLQLCEIITRSEEEKVSQSLCLRKLDIFREHWEGELFGLRMAVPLGHSTHGSGVAVHPYYFLSFQLAIGGELLLCVLRSLTSTPWIKLWHVVVAALATAVGLVATLQLAES